MRKLRFSLLDDSSNHAKQQQKMDPTVAVTSIDLEGSKKNNLSKNKSEVALMHNKL